jgi:hypothetical protein
VGVIGVEVREQDGVRIRRMRRWNRTPHSAQMAEASGQDRVEQDAGPGVPPRAGAVSPPGQRARHGAACLSGGHPDRGSGITISPFGSHGAYRHDHHTSSVRRTSAVAPVRPGSGCQPCAGDMPASS